jgi:integrase
MALTQPIRCKEQVRQFLAYYKDNGNIRNYLLCTLCVHTALRISDILSITAGMVYDFKRKRVHDFLTLTEKKTKKPIIIALNNSVKAALKAYMPLAGQGKPLFLNTRTCKAISRVQAYRLIRAAAESLNLNNRVSCHSLRKTFGYHAWKSGVSPIVLMDIYNHSSLAVTKRYLGICQDDKNDAFFKMDFIIPLYETGEAVPLNNL